VSVIALVFAALLGVFRIVNRCVEGEWTIALRDLLGGIVLGIIFWTLYLIL